MSKHAPFLMLLAILAGCESLTIENDDKNIMDRQERRSQDMEKFFGEDTLVFGRERASSEKSGNGIGVNSYLWRASLDILSFMPLKSVDPFGGVILTDWYTSPTSSNERVKIDLFILDRTLRADGLKISVFRQKLIHNIWVDQPVDAQTANELEEAILTKARQLKSEAGR